MLEGGAELDTRDLNKEPLSEPELESLIGTRDYKQFLNRRNELYREKNMEEKPPTRAEAIRLMAENPNLVRRPLLMLGEHIVLGFDEDAYKKLLKTA